MDHAKAKGQLHANGSDVRTEYLEQSWNWQAKSHLEKNSKELEAMDEGCYCFYETHTGRANFWRPDVSFLGLISMEKYIFCINAKNRG